MESTLVGEKHTRARTFTAINATPVRRNAAHAPGNNVYAITDADTHKNKRKHANKNATHVPNHVTTHERDKGTHG